MRISQYKKELTACLENAGAESPVGEARFLMGAILSVKPLEVGLLYDRELTENELAALEAAKKRLLSGEPLQYVTGIAGFLGLDITVGRGVLIPRPETEELALLAIECAKKYPRPTVLDLCCGSGAIACGIKANVPMAQVFATDISADALDFTRLNAQRLGLDITVVQGDLFENINGRCDIIVSNPPYVTEGEYMELDSNVKDYEPYIALVGGADGLDFYRRIAAEAPSRLNKGGSLLLEAGYAQCEAVAELLSAGFKAVKIIKDMYGRERMISAVLPEDSNAE